MFSDPQGLLNQPWTDQEVIAIATRKGRSLIYSDHTKYCKCIGVLWSITHITVPLLHQNEPFLVVWSQGCWRDGRPGTPLTVTAAQLPAFITKTELFATTLIPGHFYDTLAEMELLSWFLLLFPAFFQASGCYAWKSFFTAQEGKFTQRGRNIKMHTSHYIALWNYEYHLFVHLHLDEPQ